MYQCVSKVKTVFLHFCGFCLWLTNNPSVALTPTVIELSSFFVSLASALSLTDFLEHYCVAQT